jgi:hypothetical protein
MTRLFDGGTNLAMKVPPDRHDAALRFYADTLGLARAGAATPESAAFRFGATTLWIDRTPGLARAEVWLELRARDTAEAARVLAAAGAPRRDEVEPLPAGFDGFWIANPAGVIHLVAAAGS